jgi:hypothetical protein
MSEVRIGSFTLSASSERGIGTDTSPQTHPKAIPIVAKPAATADIKPSFEKGPEGAPFRQSRPFHLSRRSSAFTEDLPLAVELDFHRKGWGNRLVTDQTGKLLYFADIPGKWTGTKLDIYRGGPEKEKAIASLSRKSLNNLSFYQLPQADDQRLNIIGSRHYLGYEYYFEHDGRKYRWHEGRGCCTTKRSDEYLSDVETGEVIARFKNTSLLQVWKHKNYGKLVIYDEAWKEDDRRLDLLVLTLVAVKQRIREKRRVRALWKVVSAAADSAGGD